jgi:PST family polysaccharide transporter
VVSWPLGFVLLAAGAGRTCFVTEAASRVFLAILLHFLIANFGLKGAGIAYLAENLLYLPIVYWLAAQRISFRWNAQVTRALVTLVAALSILGVTLWIVPFWGPWIASLSAGGFLIPLFRRMHGLLRKSPAPARPERW